MKRFGMAVAALLMCATMSFAQKPSLSREPFDTFSYPAI